MHDDLYFWWFVQWYSLIFIFCWLLTVRKKWVRRWIGGLVIVLNFFWGFCLMPIFFKLSSTYRHLDASTDGIKTPYDFLITAMYLFFVFGPMFVMGSLLRKNGKIFDALQSGLTSPPDSEVSRENTECPNLIEPSKTQKRTFKGCSCKSRLRKIFTFWKSFTGTQKIFFWLSLAASILLLIAVCDVRGGNLGNGYFVFLRIITCGAFVGLILQKIPLWLKFVFILGAVLYNPIVMIHLGDRDIWALFNALSIPALLVPWICLLSKRGDSDNGTPEER